MFSCEFCQISKNTFFTEHLWATASILREGRRLKQIEISIISKLTKKIIKKRTMFLHFLFFTCCAHPFFFRASLFTKRPYVLFDSTFIVFKHAEFGKHTWVIRQKLKKHAHFKISSRDEVFTRFFFFFFSSRNEISSLSFIPGWIFISAKTCKQ